MNALLPIIRPILLFSLLSLGVFAEAQDEPVIKEECEDVYDTIEQRTRSYWKTYFGVDDACLQWEIRNCANLNEFSEEPDYLLILTANCNGKYLKATADLINPGEKALAPVTIFSVHGERVSDDTVLVYRERKKISLNNVLLETQDETVEAHRDGDTTIVGSGLNLRVPELNFIDQQVEESFDYNLRGSGGQSTGWSGPLTFHVAIPDLYTELEYVPESIEENLNVKVWRMLDLFTPSPNGGLVALSRSVLGDARPIIEHDSGLHLDWRLYNKQGDLVDALSIPHGPYWDFERPRPYTPYARFPQGNAVGNLNRTSLTSPKTVDFQDISLVAQNFGNVYALPEEFAFVEEKPHGPGPGDANGDAIVDNSDFLLTFDNINRPRFPQRVKDYCTNLVEFRYVEATGEVILRASECTFWALELNSLSGVFSARDGDLQNALPGRPMLFNHDEHSVFLGVNGWRQDDSATFSEVSFGRVLPANLTIEWLQADIQVRAAFAESNGGYIPVQFVYELIHIPEDIDENGIVNFADFLVLADNFGLSSDDETLPGDIDGNGTVNFLDFIRLAANFGTTS